ncbi:Na+/H+ antiporter NhaA [Pontibacter sp. HJ8]
MEPAAKPLLLRRIVYPFQEFARAQARSGLLVLFLTLVALAWLNSPWGYTYQQAWHSPLTIVFGKFQLSRPFSFWINSTLMAVFYLVIGLEVKRMYRSGELASFRSAAFPIAAAIGGMTASAGVYLYFTHGLETQRGWGIPLATDVACALAMLAMLGKSVPFSLRLFLSSLAILQSIGSLLPTVILYSTVTNLLALSVGTGIFGLLVVLRALRNRSMWLYLLLGLVMWAALLVAGVNAAVAGVLLALVIPVRSRVREEEFISTADDILGELHALHRIKRADPEEETEEDYQATVHTLKANCSRSLSPLRRLLHQLLPWAAYFVLPLFALSTAAFAYNSFELGDLLGPVPLGIFMGLVVGKPIGILLFSWIASVLKVATKPHDITWPQVVGAGLLAGTGFTMSLFVALEIFEGNNLMTIIKISILCASAVAAVAGFLLLSLVVKE